MNATTYTPAEFAAAFPRAATMDGAIRYVAVAHHPREFVRERDIACAADEVAVQVGYTNASRSKKVSRFAIVPGNVAGML